MASNKSFISLPSSPKLGASSSPLAGGGSKLSAAPKLTKSSFGFRPIGRSSVVDTISAAPPGQANMEAMAESLIETNRILVEIQNQLAMDFAYRIAREKGDLNERRRQESRRKFNLKERGLEAFKGVFKAVKSVGKAVASPFTGIFDRIKAILGILAAGVATNALFTWLKKEENRKRLEKFFNILTKNAGLIVKLLVALKGLRFISKLVGAFRLLKGIFTVLMNPLFLAAIGVVSAAMYQGLGENEQRALLELNDDYSEENREKLAKTYEAYKQSLYKKDPIGTRLYGFDTRIDKRIKFLREGKFSSAGKEKKVDWEGLNQGVITKSEVVDPNLLNTFTGGYFDKIWGSQSMPGWQDFRKNKVNARAMGGPIEKGVPYIVGEQGPELRVFNNNGYILNNATTERIIQLSNSNQGSVEIYDLRTVKPKTKSPASPPMQPPATSVPELNAVNNNSERTMYMSAYGIV